MFRREWSLTRPERFVRNAGILCCAAAFGAVVVGVLGSHLAARLYLRELAWMVGAPVYLAFGLLQWALFGRFRQSGAALALHLTPMRPWQVVGGWYCALLLRWQVGLAIFLLILPRFPDCCVPVSVSAQLLFVIAALAVLDVSGRLHLLLALRLGRGLLALLEHCIVAAVATLALFGVVAVFEGLPDDLTVTPIAFLVAPLWLYVSNFSTWRAFLLLAGERYVRSIRLELEDDADTVDRPSPPKFGV